MDIKIDEVYTLKITSGEEIVARVKQIENDFLMLEEPASVAPGPQGVGLIPSLFTSAHRELVRLNKNSINLIATTEESIKVRYLEAVTGLKVQSKKIVLG